MSTQFRVWAPRVRQVELELGGTRVAMGPAAGGWWFAEPDGAGPGSDYAFVLDGGEPRPDPRSAWQPHGVHGPSRVLEHAAFEWHDSGWEAGPLADAVIYELHIGTFTPQGTFEAAIERLDHLVDLGVTHVELMPVAEFPGARGWGYDGVDLYAPHHAYGGPAGLKRFVDACHARSLAVLLDVVYNHLGPAGNYLASFGPYFTSRYVTPWGDAVNLDGSGSDEVRRFLCDNALMWLRDYHMDGLRIDAVHAIHDRSAIHFLEQLAEEVDALAAALGRPLVLIAESDLNDPRIVSPRGAGGYGLDAQWNEDFHHAVHAVLTGERNGYYRDFGRLADVAKALEHAFVYDGRYSAYRGRRHGRPANGLSGHRFVGCLQNHDQIGNRAQGERLSQLLAEQRLKTAAAILLTAPFVPMLFQGEEWGASTAFQYFTAHEDPDLGAAVRSGRRAEFAAFGWAPEDVPDPQSSATFERSKLDWRECEQAPHADILAWHRQLIALRRRTADLRDGRLHHTRVRFDEAAQWLMIERGSVIVVCNLGERLRSVPLPHGVSGRLLLGSGSGVRLQQNVVELPPDAMALLEDASRAGTAG